MIRITMLIRRTARVILTVLVVLTLMEIAWGPVPWPFIFLLGVTATAAWDLEHYFLKDEPWQTKSSR